MGYLLHLDCKECGYQTHPIRFGATFKDPRIMGPALDTNKQQVVEVEYAASSALEVTLYSNQKLQKPGQPKSLTNIYNCCQHQLQTEGNYCPSCNSFNMSVTLGGLVD